MLHIDDIQRAILSENEERNAGMPLDGWVFCNFAHRDRLTDTLLDLDGGAVSSRRWFYIVPVSGDPIKIVHTIEQSVLGALPGASVVYSGAESLKRCLSRFAGSVFAVLADAELPVVSTVDAGTLALLSAAGIRTVSAASLVQRRKGLLDEAGIESHERAAARLYGIVGETWELIRSRYNAGIPICEREISDFILDSFARAKLVTDHPPIAAFGAHSGNPHYEIPEGNGTCASEGDVIQLDIWAKECGGVYADISWAGVFAREVPRRETEAFAVLAESRNLVYTLLEERLSRGERVTGFALDASVRSFLEMNGRISAVRHRTGHGIDTECHGSGVNLDSVEFPDRRFVLEGSCFSVEPGLYYDDFGIRTEIDIYIRNGIPVVSGLRGAAFTGQRELLSI